MIAQAPKTGRLPSARYDCTAQRHSLEWVYHILGAAGRVGAELRRKRRSRHRSATPTPTDRIRQIQGDAEACKSKFKTLKNTRKPTGDPRCPPNVREAKYIQREIENSAGAVVYEDEDEDEVEEELEEGQEEGEEGEQQEEEQEQEGNQDMSA